uniref:50S ribosomal protein L1 n=1 Tax=Strombidium inclinatum TaxID=197538 RepID=A0A7S3MXG8_9SPIT|mmetsp:Transcript_33383/g.51208  ORF Transcript_33383/g.51208 Transcript_33383/m.51208 type:complete len:185 (+) Transcript_33383:435-989(+)
MIRGTCVLPAGTGKTLKVCVFADADQHEALLAAGADAIGSDQVILDVVQGTADFDRIIATKEFIPQLKRHARFLGPRGLIPNKKSGTLVTADKLVSSVEESKKGLVEFRVNSASFIMTKIGMREFEDEGLTENLEAVMKLLVDKKPETVKGKYFEKAMVKTSMGRPVPLDISRYQEMASDTNAF